MKKYNRLIAISICIYLLAALGLGYGANQVSANRIKTYKIEINRIYNSLSEVGSLDKLDLRSYQYIKKVAYLPISDLGHEKRTRDFYEHDNHLNIEIRPFYDNGNLAGFLRFEYDEPTFDPRQIVLTTQLCLGLMEVSCLFILLHLKSQLIAPFLRLKKLPYDLAQGRFEGVIKEEKSRYLGDFLWGIGQLKDKLDITRKRELELQKEKKLLLLSLSHDIKTPLNTIKLYGKALEEHLYDSEEQKNHAASQIEEKATEIERYVEEIMKNAREDILDIQVKKEEFYLSEVMEKVLATYQEKCHIRMLELSIGEYENRLLKGDLERTLEVFENIFENAFKYGDGRRIEITFYEEDYCQLIRIFNTGVPVTDNEFNHLFESFYRAGNSAGKQGNGLGLYICKEIMQKMDGQIFVEKASDGMAFVLVFL